MIASYKGVKCRAPSKLTYFNERGNVVFFPTSAPEKKLPNFPIPKAIKIGKTA